MADRRRQKAYEKAQTRLGYKPAHDVRSIVKDLVDHRHLFSDFNDPRFSNIATFKRQDGIPDVAAPARKPMIAV